MKKSLLILLMIVTGLVKSFAQCPPPPPNPCLPTDGSASPCFNYYYDFLFNECAVDPICVCCPCFPDGCPGLGDGHIDENGNYYEIDNVCPEPGVCTKQMTVTNGSTYFRHPECANIQFFENCAPDPSDPCATPSCLYSHNATFYMACEGGTNKWYVDADHDGHGDPATEVLAASSPGENYVTLGDDCNDANINIYPGADNVAHVTVTGPEHFGCPATIHTMLLSANCAAYWQAELWDAVSDEAGIKKMIETSERLSFNESVIDFKLSATTEAKKYEVVFMIGYDDGGLPEPISTIKVPIAYPQPQIFGRGNYVIEQPEYFNCNANLHIDMPSNDCFDYWRLTLFSKSHFDIYNVPVLDKVYPRSDLSSDIPIRLKEPLLTDDYWFEISEIFLDQGITVLPEGEPIEQNASITSLGLFDFKLTQPDMELITENDFTATRPPHFHCPARLHINLPGNDCFEFWRVKLTNKDNLNTYISPLMPRAEHVFDHDFYLTSQSNDFELEIEKLYSTSPEFHDAFHVFTRNRIFNFTRTQDDKEPLNRSVFNVDDILYYHCDAKLHIQLPTSACPDKWRAYLQTDPIDYSNFDDGLITNLQGDGYLTGFNKKLDYPFAQNVLSQNYTLRIEQVYFVDPAIEDESTATTQIDRFNFNVTQPEAASLNTGDYNVLYPHPSGCGARLHVSMPANDCFNNWEVNLRNTDVVDYTDVFASGPKRPSDKTVDEDFTLSIGGTNHYELTVTRNYSNPDDTKVSTFNFPLEASCDGVIHLDSKTPESNESRADGSATFYMTSTLNACPPQRHELKVILRNIATGLETSATGAELSSYVTVSNLTAGNYSVSFCYADCSCKSDNVMTIEIVANYISTGAITNTVICPKRVPEPFLIPYSSVGSTFNADNMFTAQLSSADGSFLSPTVIGSSPGTAASGSVEASIPQNTGPGNGYRIRVVSSSPQITGEPSTSVLEIQDGRDLDSDHFSLCDCESDCDCDDQDSERYPGNTEKCDGKDNNCDKDRLVDEGLSILGLYPISCTDCIITPPCSQGTNHFLVNVQTDATHPRPTNINFNWTAPPEATLSGQGNDAVTLTYTNKFKSGTLSVVASSGCGDNFSSEIFVSGVPDVTSSTILGPRVVCQNTEVRYFIDAPGATSFKWKTPGTITSGDNTESVYVRFKKKGGTVEVIAENGCGKTDSKSIEVVMGNCKNGGEESGLVDDNVIETQYLSNLFIKAYPNPFTEKLNIEFALPEDSRAKLEIFNVAGQVIATLFDGEVKAFESHHLEFTPNRISRGVIFYRLRTETQTYYDKVVMLK